MPKIILIRHGETDWNRQGLIQGQTDNPLNQLGFSQAKAAAPLFLNTRIDAMISSPMIRARQTAETLANEIDFDASDILFDSRIIERDFGAANGKHVNDVYEQVFTGEIDHLESERAIMSRVMEGLTEFAHAYPAPEQVILVIAHSHVIKAALHAIAPERYSFRERLVNVSANYLSYDLTAETWEIEAINVTADGVESETNV
ncbi:MAG: histidine phosphatase family protein [Culicoidibacterales bacterium]